MLTALAERPVKMASRLKKGQAADAYLAAYAQWLCEDADLEDPGWVHESGRTLAKPWYEERDEERLKAVLPTSFASRRVFCVPEGPCEVVTETRS